MGNFVTVSRGDSAAVFLPDQGFQVQFDSPPTRIRMRTRWRNAGVGHPLPEQLWVEAYGEGESLDETVPYHDALSRNVAVFLSYVANASIGTLELELAYDATPGLDQRPYLQTFVREEPARPNGGRIVPTDRLLTCFNGWMRATPNDRLNRALFQYSLALRSWRTGTEYQCLDHLWIAAENVASLHLRRRLAGRRREELADELGIDTGVQRWGNELDAWSRRELVFAGDATTYRSAKDATDGYEHGFMDLNDVQRTAIAATESAFGHVRRAIADLLDLRADDRSWLLKRKPIDVASTRKSIRGALVGNVANPAALAHPNHEYPILRWSSRVKSFARNEDSFDAVFTESLTAIAASGVTIEGHAIETRGRRHPDDDVKYGEARVESTINLDSLDLGDVRTFLDRSVKSMTSVLTEEVSVPANRAVILGMLSHGVALAESVTALISDRRAVEALEIAALLFESSIVLRWLGDHGDRGGGMVQQMDSILHGRPH